MFEQRLIYYCAPTLAGLKTAGLFNTHGIPDAIVKQEANRLTGLLADCGLALRLFAKRIVPRWFIYIEKATWRVTLPTLTSGLFY